MIRNAILQDLYEIKNLTETCAVAMQKKDIFQWNKHYPSREKLKEDIRRKELFVLEDTIVKGIIVLTETMDKEYFPINWLTENKNNLYVHRLATLPSTWGSGNGKTLMDFAESYAKENNFSSVRLDTFSKNPRNQRFYESRGYQKLGSIFFPEQSKHPFYCYELVF